jgi:murein DD-endopeptidase MepM/ murein hydrolase activator NlpD
MRQLNIYRGTFLAVVIGLLLLAPTGAFASPSIVLSPKKVGPGDIMIVTVRSSSAPTAGTFLGRTLRFNGTKKGFAAIVGIDLYTEPGKYPLMITAGGKKISRKIRISKKKYPLQRLTLPAGEVTLSPENEARADREQKELSAVWPVDSLRLWTGRFIDPLPGKEVTTIFGVRRIINGIPKSSHSGVDLAADIGEPVRAPNDGVVVIAEEQFFSGNSVIIDHGEGIYTMFFHLSAMKVKPGQAVMKGDVLGLTGESGRATGPCLHWGARVQGARVDPLELIRLKVE